MKILLVITRLDIKLHDRELKGTRGKKRKQLILFAILSWQKRQLESKIITDILNGVCTVYSTSQNTVISDLIDLYCCKQTDSITYI